MCFIKSNVLFLLCLTMIAPLYSMEQPGDLVKVFDHLADRLYCIAEATGNKNDMQTELDKTYDKLREFDKTHSLNPQNTDHRACFFGACAFGDKRMVQMFLGRRFDIEQQNEGGQTPYMIAFCKANIEAMKFLKERGANVNARDKHGSSAQEIFALCLRDPLSVIPVLVIANARFGVNISAAIIHGAIGQ